MDFSGAMRHLLYSIPCLSLLPPALTIFIVAPSLCHPHALDITFAIHLVSGPITVVHTKVGSDLLSGDIQLKFRQSMEKRPFPGHPLQNSVQLTIPLADFWRDCLVSLATHPRETLRHLIYLK